MTPSEKSRKLIDLHRIKDKVVALVAISVLVLIVTSVTQYFLGKSTQRVLNTIQTLRIQVPIATSEIISGANRVAASQRAYLMTGKNDFKEERKAVWKEQIEPAVENLSELRELMQVEEHQQAVDQAIIIIDQYNTIQEGIDKFFESRLKGISAASMINADIPLEDVQRKIAEREQLVDQLNELIVTKASPARKALRNYLMPLKKAQEELLRKDNISATRNIDQSNLIVTLVAIVANILVIIVATTLIRSLRRSIAQPTNLLKKMAKGELNENIEASHDELNEVIDASRILSSNLERASEFAVEIGEGNFDHEFTPASENDLLGNSLLQMRNKLQQVAEQDRQTNWVTNGQAQLSDILRREAKHEDELHDAIIQFLVKYFNANQGVLFLLETEEDQEVLKLTASYAYGRKKFIQSSFLPGEGLIGQIFLEKEITVMNEIPEDHVSITSGLGQSPPNYIVICPLISNDVCYGVFEIASFSAFEEYRIELLAKLGEQIATTLSKVKINNQTRLLLEEARQQTEELRSQEEEMQQNMEELSATQEEMTRKEKEYQQIIQELKDKITQQEA
ncbi:GAF domain-containing protein [Tunicatimonas pelagia]|uniref:GAF domain-containing protein n=1 Tax=Tunicatimonas pelagia TaxID=931531 RepID=UPI002666A86D|nr:GAF domain-containing protein [Tunicatimonas pelagia]WKN41056.1 GAF domain-containing protein [Tunicatimonas pelagia]